MAVIVLISVVVIALAAMTVKVFFPNLFARLFDTEMVPPGYFTNGLILWGDEFTSETYVAKGMELEGLADMRSLDDEALDELYGRNLQMLSMAAPGDALKIHYTIEDDYEVHLRAFDEDTEAAAGRGKAAPWTTLQRRIATANLRERSRRQELAHEKVYLYWCRKTDAVKEMGGRVRFDNAQGWLRQQEKNLRLQLEQVAVLFGCSIDGVMGDAEHCLHFRKWANPSLAELWAQGTDAVADMDLSAPIANNVLRSDTVPFVQADDRVMLRMDGMYHAFYVITGRGRCTDMRKTRNLLDAVKRGIQITQTIYPLDPQAEIENGLAMIQALESQKSQKKGNIQVVDDQQDDLRKRVSMLNTGQSLPNHVFWAVHVYAPDLDTLTSRTTALKSALTAMDGLRYMEINHPETARRILAETCPGWAGSTYRGWDLYWESYNLADTLPLSASFTGFLKEADALVQGERGTVVGIRLFDRATRTPQFAVNCGKVGSGKTSDSINIMSQAAQMFSFMAVFDEGLAWHTTAQLLGMRSVILREGSTPTINPFDPNGLPRTGTLFSEIASLGMTLVGSSGSNDVNENRRGLIVQYARALSDAVSEDFLRESQDRELDLARELVAVLAFKDTLREESDLADAYVAWLELQRTDKADAERRLAAVRSEEIVAVTTRPEQRRMLRDYAYTRIPPERPPQWKQLVFAFQAGRLPIHTGPEVSDNLKADLETLGTRLARGISGGELGNFIDGVTNLQLEAPGIYVETSFLAKDSLLRNLAPMAILMRLRRYFVTRPRSELKAVVNEEFKKLAEIPGYEKATQENLAQFRKYAVWMLANFQAPSQIDEVNPALTSLLLGQSAQFWLHAMPVDDVNRLGDVRQLPAVARRAIVNYKLLADQTGGVKAPYMGLFVPTGNGTYVWGTSRNFADPYMRYVIESSGGGFDQRQEALRKYADPLEGVISEVDAQLNAMRTAALQRAA
jgi:hypothetical protein